MRSKLFIFLAIAILAQIKTLAADAMSPQPPQGYDLCSNYSP